MPIWAEVFVNLIGYAGFIALASRGGSGNDQIDGDEI